MNPVLAARLGITPNRGLTPSEVAFLLNGQRADGRVIAGKQIQAATQSLIQIFGLKGDERPSRDQLEHMLSGRTASGESLPEKTAAAAVKRLETAFGAKGRELSVEERENILSARLADGRVLSDRAYMALLEASKSRIGYIDLTFSAPKSLSVAWAFAPTNAERAMMHQAHSDAIESVMCIIEKEIGRARMGKGGKDGYEPGSIGWVSFDHYAARPTVASSRAMNRVLRPPNYTALPEVMGGCQAICRFIPMSRCSMWCRRPAGASVALIWPSLMDAFMNGARYTRLILPIISAAMAWRSPWTRARKWHGSRPYLSV
jgi:hypothetical protein